MLFSYKELIFVLDTYTEGHCRVVMQVFFEALKM